MCYGFLMRPLSHPALEEITIEGILYALSDPIRLRIVAELAQGSCGKRCSNFSEVKGKPLAKSTLSQHFRILREAGLIRSERHGVEVSSSLRCEELSERFGDLLENILTAYQAQLSTDPKKRKKR